MTDLAIDTLVFDLDGVLVDSRALMEHAYGIASRFHALEQGPPVRAFLSHAGRPLNDIVRELSLPAAFAETYQRVSRVGLHIVRVVDGVRDLLSTARERCAFLGLLTGKERKRTLQLLDHFGLRQHFDRIICGDDPLPGKPDPAGLLTMIRRRGASKAAFVGDSPVDVVCALRACVMSLGAGWGLCSPGELAAAGASRTFERPGDLQRWLTEGGTT